MNDKRVFKIIKLEEKRQNNNLELIASENVASKQVRKALSSCLTNKYAEGYPNRRYYGGCKYIDQIEQLAIDRACVLFNCRFANVQPHSGSQANAAAYKALLPNGGKILAMELNDGGHLTHGSPVSFSSHLYEFCFFPLDETNQINFDLVEKAIIKNKPDAILAGCSAYPYYIDFSKFRELADKYNLKFIVDMAHIAGLVAAGAHQSPIPYADIVTTTTHKTLRGPRGGLILTNDEKLIQKINTAVFPYYQGGPLENTIAAKAVCFNEAMQPSFKKYIFNLRVNMDALWRGLYETAIFNLKTITCSDTDNHLLLLNTKETFDMTGLGAQKALEKINITTNKNMLPHDNEHPTTTSGLRLGLAAVTTRGCTQKMAYDIGVLIYDYLSTYKIYSDKKWFFKYFIKRVHNITKKLKKV